MAEAVLKHTPASMTVPEFLDWDDGTDTRYELVAGKPVAMAPGLVEHGRIHAALILKIGSRLKPPCQIFNEIGIRIPEQDDRFYVANIAIICGPWRVGERYMSAPTAIIEVLSPSTAAHDRGNKAADYRTIPSLQEIVLVYASAVRVELWRRTGEGWLIQDIIGQDAVLNLASVDAAVPLREIYEGITFEPPQHEAQVTTG